MLGGYYVFGSGGKVEDYNIFSVGGLAGGPHLSSSYTAWYKDTVGSGGRAGTGGIISYYDINNLFAFNGDLVTNGDYDTNYFDYDKDGKKTGDLPLKVQKMLILDGSEKNFIPSKIFAQSGVIRATYTTNQGAYTLSKVKRQLGDSETIPKIARSADDVVLFLATDEAQTERTGYTNPLTPELENQGIGSRSWISRS